MAHTFNFHLFPLPYKSVDIRFLSQVCCSVRGQAPHSEERHYNLLRLALRSWLSALVTRPAADGSFSMVLYSWKLSD